MSIWRSIGQTQNAWRTKSRSNSLADSTAIFNSFHLSLSRRSDPWRSSCIECDVSINGTSAGCFSLINRFLSTVQHWHHCCQTMWHFSLDQPFAINLPTVGFSLNPLKIFTQFYSRERESIEDEQQNDKVNDRWTPIDLISWDKSYRKNQVDE